MDAKNYIKWLREQPFVLNLVPLKGDMADEYEEAKLPMCKWGNPEVLAQWTDDRLAEHLDKGGWIGYTLKKGYVVVDVDEPDAKQKVLEIYGNDTFAYETKRGVHLVYADGSYPLQAGRRSCLILQDVDYKPSGNHYLVAPLIGGRRWNQIYKVATIPIEFAIQKPTAEVKNHWEQQGALYDLEEGNRNNLLFSIGRAIRNRFEVRNEPFEEPVEEALHRVNQLFAEPLPSQEVDQIIKSVCNGAHREDFDPTKTNGGDPFFQDGNDVLQGENPFAKVRPLREYLNEPSRPPFWEGVCRRGDVVLIAGAPKSGKSTLVRSLIASGVTDADQPFPVVRGNVLWYIFEEYPTDVAQTVYRFVPSVAYEIYANETNPASEPNALEKFVFGLRDAILETNAVAVYVDVIGDLLHGVDINDYNQMRYVMGKIRAAIKGLPSEPTIFLVHHTNKGGATGTTTPLGSTAIVGSCDVVITVANEDGTTTMKVMGRGVAAHFNQQDVPLRFNSNTQMYEGIGYSLSDTTLHLIELVATKKIKTINDIKTYQGGVFRADFQRLLRKLILKVQDGLLYVDNERAKPYLDAIYRKQHTEANHEEHHGNNRNHSQVAANHVGVGNASVSSVAVATNGVRQIQTALRSDSSSVVHNGHPKTEVKTDAQPAVSSASNGAMANSNGVNRNGHHSGVAVATSETYSKLNFWREYHEKGSVDGIGAPVDGRWLGGYVSASHYLSESAVRPNANGNLSNEKNDGHHVTGGFNGSSGFNGHYAGRGYQQTQEPPRQPNDDRQDLQDATDESVSVPSTANGNGTRTEVSAVEVDHEENDCRRMVPPANSGDNLDNRSDSRDSGTPPTGERTEDVAGTTATTGDNHHSCVGQQHQTEQTGMEVHAEAMTALPKQEDITEANGWKYVGREMPPVFVDYIKNWRGKLSVIKQPMFRLTEVLPNETGRFSVQPNMRLKWKDFQNRFGSNPTPEQVVSLLSEEHFKNNPPKTLTDRLNQIALVLGWFGLPKMLSVSLGVLPQRFLAVLKQEKDYSQHWWLVPISVEDAYDWMQWKDVADAAEQGVVSDKAFQWLDYLENVIGRLETGQWYFEKWLSPEGKPTYVFKTADANADANVEAEVE